MKRIIFLAIITAVLCSCSDKIDLGHEIDSCVYLLNPGESSVKINSDSDAINVWVCKGGYDSKVYNVEAIIDEEDVVKYSAETKKSFTMLPGNAYELKTPSVKLDKETIKAPVVISIDPSCVASGKIFILPVRISCDGDVIIEGKSVSYILITKQ